MERSLSRAPQNKARRLGFRMEHSGAAEECCVRAKLLNGLVGAWGFEPQTPTVSIVFYPGPTLLKSTSTKFPKKNSHCTHCIHCFSCSFCTFFVCQIVCQLYTTDRTSRMILRSKELRLSHSGVHSRTMRYRLMVLTLSKFALTVPVVVSAPLAS